MCPGCGYVYGLLDGLESFTNPTSTLLSLYTLRHIDRCIDMVMWSDRMVYGYGMSGIPPAQHTNNTTYTHDNVHYVNLYTYHQVSTLYI